MGTSVRELGAPTRKRGSGLHKQKTANGCWSDQKVKKALGLSLVGEERRGTERGEFVAISSCVLAYCIYVYIVLEVVVRPHFVNHKLYTSMPSKFVP